LTLEPIPDESLTGYIFRLASYRRLTSARALAAECGFDRFTDQPQLAWLEALAQTSGVEVHKLAAISMGPFDYQYSWWRGQRFRRRLLNRRSVADRRLCPQCMSELEYHRAVWNLKYIAACPIHRCLLIDMCAVCDAPLRWQGRSLSRCPCDADLRKVTSPLVSDIDAETTGAVYGLLGDPHFQAAADRMRAMPPFQGLLGSDIAEFLFRLGVERLGGGRKAFATENLGELAWEAHVALRLGLEAVVDWPVAFMREIDAMRDRRGGNANLTLLRCVGNIEYWLSHLQKGSRGLAIAAAVAEYRRQDAARRGLPVQPDRHIGIKPESGS
jgi:hypothetical protein